MSEAADLGNEIVRLELELMAIKKRVAHLELRSDGHDTDLRSLDGKLERIRLELEEFHRVIVSIHENQSKHGKLLEAIAQRVGVTE
jgi:chromosome segregation ATPase